MTRIYISGPITGIKGYMERFRKAEEVLKECGAEVVNPAKVIAEMPEGLTHGECMKLSLAMLGTCNGIFMLEDWQESTGCNIEFEFAYEHKMTIFFEGGK